ncbi:MAG: hypothetical protein V4515_14285 [Chloroflexota bacterium]
MRPDQITAERDDFQPTGEAYCEFAVTSATVAAIPPHGRLAVAAYLRAILARIGGSSAYEDHRAILGSVLVDLEGYTVRDALVDETDLRDPAIVASEREAIQATRDWASLRRASSTEAYHDHVTRLLDDRDR